MKVKSLRAGSKYRAWSREISDFETGNPPEGWKSEGQFQLKVNEAKLIQFSANR
jgi:hypothetical protein